MFILKTEFMHKAKINNRKKAAFAFLAPALFLLCGCAQIYTGDATAADSTKYVYVEMNKRDTSRSILPKPIDISDASKNYYFYIWGESRSTSIGEISPRKVEFEAESNLKGKFELDFPVADYYFTLAVTNENLDGITDGENIRQKSIFVGYSTADLSVTRNVKFNLTPNKLAGTGNVNLDLYLDSSWTDDKTDDLLNLNYKVTAGLYDINTEEVVNNFSKNIAGINKTTPVSFELPDVPNGDYKFSVKFSKSTSDAVYEYTDLIRIYANRDTEAAIYIPDVVVSPPAAPEDFKAGYIEAEPDEDYKLGTYKTVFNWTDKSNNENYFKLTLVNVSKMTTFPEIPDVMTDEKWEQITYDYIGSEKIKTFDYSCESSDEYCDGSLNSNSTELVLYLL